MCAYAFSTSKEENWSSRIHTESCRRERERVCGCV